MDNDEYKDITPYVSTVVTLIIQTVLVILKLTNVLTCPWWLILLPLEITGCAGGIVCIIIAIILIVNMYFYNPYKKTRARK